MTSIRCTVFAPHWGATGELQEFAEARQAYPHLIRQFRGFPVSLSRELGSEVIQFNRRMSTVPEGLQDIPLAAIKVVELSTDLSTLDHTPDGPYAEGDVVAHVDTICLSRVVVRIFRVSGGKNAGVEEINDWLDALIAGEKPRELQPAV